MRKVRVSVWMMAVTAAAASVILALPSVRMSSLETETPAKVSLLTVENGEICGTTALRGALRYEQEYAAIAPVTGIVAEVYVSPGDRVTKGQALLRMDSTAEAAAISGTYAAQEAGSLTEIDWDGLTETAIARQQAALDAMTLRASADGHVIDVVTGQYSGVLAGNPAVLLCGEEQQIVCSASVSDAAEIMPGMHARIIVRGAEACGASVTHVGAAQVDPAAGQTVCKVTLRPDAQIDLPIGSPVEAEIERFTYADVTVLPLTALSENGTVWVVSDDRCWEIAADVCVQDDLCCWISLPEGTLVVDRPQGLLEGQRIREARP